MSRHRNVRNLDLDEEYAEAYDESVYGRSVDDHDYGVSPSSEQYLYTPKRAGGNLGAYFGITEERVEPPEEQQVRERHFSESTYQKPKLSQEDELKLRSVLDELRSILGEAAEESEMTATVISYNYDLEQSLDHLLHRNTLDHILNRTNVPGAAAQDVQGGSTVAARGAQHGKRGVGGGGRKGQGGDAYGGHAAAADVDEGGDDGDYDFDDYNDDGTGGVMQPRRTSQGGGGGSGGGGGGSGGAKHNKQKPHVNKQDQHDNAERAVRSKQAAKGQGAKEQAAKGQAAKEQTAKGQATKEQAAKGYNINVAANKGQGKNTKGFQNSNSRVNDFDSPRRDACAKTTNSTTATPDTKPTSTPTTTPTALPPKLPTKQRDVALDVEAAWREAYGGADSKPLLSLVVVGHVDAGKSTLTGHLLYLQGSVSKRQMHKYEQESKKAGKQTMYAWVMDETEEERSRGVTVDIAQRSLETPGRLLNILDAPGHRDFIPNMLSGAARADVALLVVDASTGEFEAGFEANGQTREHAMLVKSLGVSQLAVAINKLDTVNWNEARFEEIRGSLASFLKSVGFKSHDVTYVPCSGLTGENLVMPPTQPELCCWYTGPTVMQAIDAMQPPEREILRPTRFSLNDVFRGSGGGSSSISVAGKLHTGCVQVGDKLLLMPQAVAVTVKDVTGDSGSSVGRMFAGDSGTMSLAGVDAASMPRIGDFLCDPAKPMLQVTRFQARLVLFNVTVPLIKGAQVEFHHQSLCVPATIRRIVSQINKSTGEVVKKRPRMLAGHTAGVVEVEAGGRPLCVEVYKDCRELGRFMLRQQGATVAAGLITEILACKEASAEKDGRGGGGGGSSGGFGQL